MNLDHTKFTATCPRCQHQTVFTLGEFKAADTFACPACGAQSPTTGAEFREAIERIQKAADEVRETFRRLNRK